MLMSSTGEDGGVVGAAGDLADDHPCQAFDTDGEHLGICHAARSHEVHTIAPAQNCKKNKK